jgi:hypothetical protein
MSNVHPMMESGNNGSVQTASTGTNYTTLGAQACKQVTICNDTGTKLEVQQDGAGAAFRIHDNSYYTFYGLRNASQLGIRRADTSNTQVTATYRCEA